MRAVPLSLPVTTCLPPRVEGGAPHGAVVSTERRARKRVGKHHAERVFGLACRRCLGRLVGEAKRARRVGVEARDRLSCERPRLATAGILPAPASVLARLPGEHRQDRDYDCDRGERCCDSARYRDPPALAPALLPFLPAPAPVDDRTRERVVVDLVTAVAGRTEDPHVA